MSAEETAADPPTTDTSEAEPTIKEGKEEKDKEQGDAPTEIESASKKRTAEDEAEGDVGKRTKVVGPEPKDVASSAIPPAPPIVIPPPPPIPAASTGVVGYAAVDAGAYALGGQTVQAMLDQCYAMGLCRPGELDQRVLESLRNLNPQEGQSAMTEFMKADMSRVRNKSAYLSGVISRIKDDRMSGRNRGVFDQLAGMQMMAGGAYVPAVAAQPLAHAQYNQLTGLADYGAMQYGAGANLGMLSMGYGSVPQHSPNFSILPLTVQQTMEQLFMRGTVHRFEIDQKCVDGLRALPEHLAIEAIQDFSCRDLLQIRNKSAYFMGCINKRKENLQMGGGLPQMAGEAANSPQVRARLEEIFATGIMPRETLDYRAWSEFSKLREAEAMSALDEFMSSDMSRIRNKAAYFMGICKKRSSG